MTSGRRTKVSAAERAQSPALLEFTQIDAVRLRELQPFAERHVVEIVDALYDQLLSSDAAGAIPRDEETVRWLKQRHREYFLSLTSGEYGQTSCHGRWRAGAVERRSNLPPPWDVGSYGLYIRLLLPRLIAEFGSEPERLDAYLASLLKVMCLDMGSATDAGISGVYVNRTPGEQRRETVEQATTALAVPDARASARQPLVAMLVHDIRNPLAGIHMTAQLMLRHHEELSEAQMSRVRRIERSASDVLRMVGNALEINTLEAGMLAAEPEDFPVGDIMRQSVEDARPHIDDAEVSVLIDPPPAPVHVWADRMLTRRILQNLLYNAIRHSHASEIRLTAVSQEDTVLVGVADRGAGVPAEYHQLIFERFRHFDRDASAHADSGLGLSFCKLAVERMGGVLWVDSSEGQGATFYFTLPRSAMERVE